MRSTSRSQTVSRTILIILALALIALAFIGRRANLIGFEEVGGMQLALLGLGATLISVAVLNKRIVKLYQTIAVILLNTLLFLLIVELMVIFSFNLQFITGNHQRVPEGGATPYFKKQSWGTTVWIEHDMVTAGFQYEPYILWGQTPFAGDTINIDEDGRRIVPNTACDNPNAYIIFMYGGSTMWGMGVPDWGTIPAYLQEQLANEIEQPLCVINFGELAYVSTQEALSLMLEVRAGNVPDMVIFYDGINDTIAAINSGEAGQTRSPVNFSRAFDGNSRPTLPGWFGNTYTVRFISALRQPALTEQDTSGEAEPPKTEEELTDDVLAIYESNYRLVEFLAEDAGFDFLFIWQPVLVIGDKVMTEDEQIAAQAPPAGLQSLYASVWADAATLANELDNMVYFGDVFDGVETYAYYDHVHLVPEGNAIVAEAIADLIITEQIIR